MISITRRDMAVAAIAAGATAALIVVGARTGVVEAAQQPAKAIQHSDVLVLSKGAVTKTEFGTQTQLLRAPTATLDELEIHYTTLLPGDVSHDPHSHPNEELVIMREGELETLSGGVWKKAGPGDIIFNASNELHGVRNIGKVAAAYTVVNWTSPGQKK